MKMAAIRVVLFGIACSVIGCGGGEAPSVETSIGEDGGDIELGSVTLTIAADLLPEPVTVSIKQRSSLQAALERDFGPDGYAAVGPAYELSFPFCAPVPVSLEMSYEPADVPAGYAASNLAIFVYSEIFYESDPASTTQPQGLEWTGLFFLPTEVNEEAGVASADLSCAATVQLVAMASPAKVVPASVPAAEATAQTNVLHPKLDVDDGVFIVVMLPEIADLLDDQEEEQVFTELRAGLSAAYQTLVGTKSFPAPPLGTMTVIAKKLPVGLLGRVMPKYPTIIEIDPLQTGRLTQSTVAHEFFHIIQNWNTNAASILAYFLGDRWFKEGSAEWARDEVFNDIHDHYQAPTAERFTLPLNKESAGGAVAGEDFVYETVAFWKWLEVRYSGTILKMVRRQRELTHECSSSDPTRCFRNIDAVNYIDSLQGIIQGLAGFDFVNFFVDSLYWKNFDEDEKEPGDLWANLGETPRDVQFTFFGRDDPFELRKGGEGDGLEQAKIVEYSVTPHLTADAMLVTNAASPLSLSGQLHVKFRPASSLANLAGIVIARDSTKENRVTGLDTEKEVTLSFGPGSEVAIIIVDPKLKPSSSAGLAGIISLWVEPEESPCGDLPGTIHQVNASSELLSVIEEAEEGDTVLIAAGTYTLPSTALPGGGDYGGNRGALSVTKELTLAGAGPDKTELRTQSTDGIIWALNNAHTTFRDLTVVSIAGQGPTVPAFAVRGVERLTFCNVEVYIPQDWTERGVSLAADIAGLPTLKRVEIVDSAFWGPRAEGSLTTGFHIGYGGGDQGAQVTFMVRNSRIADWSYGVFYIDRTETYPHLPDVTLDVDDCASTFFNNGLFNVCERPPQGGLCVEKCPTN
jgi:hypothetical protein